MATNVKQILDNIKQTKSTDYDTVLMEKTRGSVLGSVVGAGMGLVYGVVRKQNLLISAFIGSLLGGVVTHYFISKKKKDESE